MKGEKASNKDQEQAGQHTGGDEKMRNEGDEIEGRKREREDERERERKSKREREEERGRRSL